LRKNIVPPWGNSKRHFTPVAAPDAALSLLNAATPDPAKIAAQLIRIAPEHRDLDAAIAKLAEDPTCEDDLAIKRLKKRKLRIKDMSLTENQLIPDLDA
jgi:hypothetical protein